MLAGGWTANSIVTLQSGIPVHAPVELQPIEQWRHKKPGAPIRKSGVYWIGDYRIAIQWFNPAAFLAPPAKQRLLR